MGEGRAILGVGNTHLLFPILCERGVEPKTSWPESVEDVHFHRHASFGCSINIYTEKKYFLLILLTNELTGCGSHTVSQKHH